MVPSYAKKVPPSKRLKTPTKFVQQASPKGLSLCISKATASSVTHHMNHQGICHSGCQLCRMSHPPHHPRGGTGLSTSCRCRQTPCRRHCWKVHMMCSGTGLHRKSNQAASTFEGAGFCWEGFKQAFAMRGSSAEPGNTKTCRRYVTLLVAAAIYYYR